MKFHPMLFSNPMVAALLNGTKTQTRRTKGLGLERINQSPDNYVLSAYQPLVQAFFFNHTDMTDADNRFIHSPYDKGDIIYVREEHYVIGSWQLNHDKELKSGKDAYLFRPYILPKYDDTTIRYSDNPPKEYYVGRHEHAEVPDWYKRNSLFMPKEYARLFLEITDIKCERLHDISQSDAIAEGIQQLKYNSGVGILTYFTDYINSAKTHLNPIKSYLSLWQSINGRKSLDSNPWVFAYTFRLIPKPENFK